MILNSEVKLLEIKKENTVFKFLESGDIFEIFSGDIMINMFNGTNKEGSMNNLYLRLYEKNSVKVIPLFGIKSNSKLMYDENSVLFYGEYEDLKYSVRFTLFDKSIWFYEVDLHGENLEFDILYCQDVSIAHKKATTSNELYTSQYIDHKILENENGYVVCSRQNQDQNGKFPYIEQGCLNSKIISYSTDQMSFFTKEYKLTNVPFYLDKNLLKENYQFELSYICLQTEKMKLNGQKKVVFYALYKEDYPHAIENLKFTSEINEKFEKLVEIKNEFKNLDKVSLKEEFNGVISSLEFSKDEINEIYKERKFEEYENENLLSFFTKDHSHVVLQRKEILCERPHGNIIINGISKDRINRSILSSTNYMYGLFNSQVVIGNTSLNKMMSVNRGLLNVLKNSGERIYIKLDGKFKMLSLAGIYEMGVNFSTWYYKIKDDVIKITSYVSLNEERLCLEVESLNNNEYEFLITNQIVMGESEFEGGCEVFKEGNKIKIYPLENSFLKNTYPNINYEIIFSDCEFCFGGDEVFFLDNVRRNQTLITFKINNTSKFKKYILSSLDQKDLTLKPSSFEEERRKFLKFYDDLINGFNIKCKNSKYDMEKLNEVVHFYTHNALIHFSSPHGLEQSGGAAWGTRDVCQGPIEYFMATHNYKIIREILIETFSHQFKQTGEFPQWFMFDKYNMQQDDSHGDIIFWPLKVISEYIAVTGDKEILNEKCVYRSFPTCEILEGETILSHIKRGVESIKKRFLDGTYLISYEGGDWDDTLQPINELFKKRLISTWTMALSYETFKKLYLIIDEKDFKDELFKIYNGIQRDFLKFSIKDDVIGGFLYLHEDGKVEYIIHPDDKKTGINYRLLPLTRSIISEIVDKNQGEINESIIDKHLTFNDGIRLMDMTPKYNGGISKIFKRAERASNVGREISLQYVHAHIRFIGSMCKLKESEKVWEALFKINPIKINDNVKNAEYRQSNTYFSSSEGDFKSRYDFQENFHKLRSGEVKVKGGWRIYSSGPGIFINQLITNVIGIRERKDKIIFDPIFPKDFKEVEVDYKILNKKVKIMYVLNEGNEIRDIILNGEKLPINNEENIYRNDFKSLDKKILEEKLTSGENLIQINFK